ncbi:MAG: hypothetical protein Q4G28_04390 [Neisseria sp.]|nr:hypothetical protein [Neisseria sp.]
MNTRTFRHISGIGGLFIKLEGRSHWLPVNDAEWQPDPAAGSGFVFRPEQYYALTDEAAAAVAPDDRLLVFSTEAEAIARRRLDALALAGLAQDLRAAAAEYDLEALIEAIDRHLRQDDLYR